MKHMLAQWTPVQLERDLDLLGKACAGGLDKWTVTEACEAAGYSQKLSERLARALQVTCELKAARDAGRLAAPWRRAIVWREDNGLIRLEVLRAVR